MSLKICKIIIISVLVFVALPAGAQNGSNRPWEEYSKSITSKTQVAALSNDLFQEQVDLYTGRLSFRHVDIDIPGNSDLPVTLARTFQVQDPIVASEFAQTDPAAYDLSLVDWELDVPRVSGVFAHKVTGNMLGPGGLESNPGLTYAWPDQRCSGDRVPPIIGQFFPGEYWQGISANMPGGGEMLEPAAGVQSPSVGGPYRWVTTGFTWFSCLPSIKNSTGQGFLAITADGTKYWFDWMARFKEPTLYTSFYYFISTPVGGYEEVFEQQLMRKRNVLYATRVEDRFGNWVTYNYSNAATAPARLDSIQSNDGRQITLAYDAAGHIASASDGARIWTYQYATSSTPKRLEKVIFPDNSRWTFDLGNQITALAVSSAGRASCNYPGVINSGEFFASNNASLSLTHPSGAIGEFEVGPRLHGRSNVPQNCQAVPDDDTPGGAYSDYVKMYWTNSLIRKRVTGPGLTPMQWDYNYINSQKTNQTASYTSQNYSPPGSWAPGPYTYTRIPDNGKPLTHISTHIIADPVCLSDSCAGKVSTEVQSPGGEWARYTFGNSYRYNEHKLLKVERGTDPNAILSTHQTAYEFARSGQTFPTPVGLSRQYKGDAITDTHLRPMRSTIVTQDGVQFKSMVNSFDAFGRPVNVTKSSSPTP